MNYIDIDKNSISNGTGFRVVLWVTGCPHHCGGCHNPETWNCSNGVKFDNNAKSDLFEYMSKPYIKGITLSGGDPLADENVPEILSLVKEIKSKFPDKGIWLYTGYTWEEITINPFLFEVVCNVDYLVDGRYEDDKRDITLAFRGSTNQRIIDVQKSILNNVVYMRS